MSEGIAPSIAAETSSDLGFLIIDQPLAHLALRIFDDLCLWYLMVILLLWGTSSKIRLCYPSGVITYPSPSTCHQPHFGHVGTLAISSGASIDTLILGVPQQ